MFVWALTLAATHRLRGHQVQLRRHRRPQSSKRPHSARRHTSGRTRHQRYERQERVERGARRSASRGGSVVEQQRVCAPHCEADA